MNRKYGQRQDLILKNLTQMQNDIRDFAGRIIKFQEQELGTIPPVIAQEGKVEQEKPENVFVAIEREGDKLKSQINHLNEVIKQLENSINETN